MMRKHAQQRAEQVMNLRGGIGPIGKLNLFEKEEVSDWLNLAAILTLEPGSTIGQHPHIGEAEFFYILEGQVYGLDAGQEVLLEAGDVTFTADGQEHRLQNRSDKTARVLAVIIRE